MLVKSVNIEELIVGKKFIYVVLEKSYFYYSEIKFNQKLKIQKMIYKKLNVKLN